MALAGFSSATADPPPFGYHPHGVVLKLALRFILSIVGRKTFSK
jgi:hypothetical protein